MTALQDGTDGGNGLYRYTTTPSTFPDASFNSENYWVDVVFEDGPDTTKPTVTGRTPASGATAVSVGANVTATFSEPVQQSTLGLELRGPGGTLVAGATTYDAATRTATLDPTANLAAATQYTATVTGVRDTAGNQVDPVTWTFTTDTPDTTKPTVTSRAPAPGAGAVSTAVNVTATFSEPVQAGTITVELRTPANALVAGTTTYDATSRTATLDPTASLAPSTTYTASVSGTRDTAGNQMDAVSWTFTTAATTSSCPCTIWPSTTAPAGTDPDTSSVELGVKFRTDTPGFVTGIRYYRPSQATGTHVGSLWTSTGTRLGQVTFTGGSASGWQEATFSSPIAVSANTTYVASYFTPSRYVVNSGYFSSAATTRGPADGPAERHRRRQRPLPLHLDREHLPEPELRVGELLGGRGLPGGVHRHHSADAHQPGPGPGRDRRAGRRPAAGEFSESVTGPTVSMVLRGPANQVVPSATSYDAGTRTATLTPTTDLAYSTSYTVEVSGARDGSSNTMSPVSWSFQTSAPPPPGVEDGPGGPLAVVTSAGNPSSSYLSEILRAEGLNEFANVRVSTLNATTLAPYAVVVLGDVAITDSQVTALTDWVNAGGNLVAMRPDSRLHGLAGITAQTGTVADGYIAVNAAVEPGAGITTDTMQFHGTANRYVLNGATSVATLYSSATTSTSLPAVTLRSVGTNGGQVATFAFDLARSVIATRQGNLAWAGQDRDGATPNRSNDLFFGGSLGDRLGQPVQGAHPAGRRAAAAARQPGDRHGPRPVPGAEVLVLPRHHQGRRRGHRRRPRHGRYARPLQHLRRSQPVGLLGRPVGVPPLHVVRLPEHPDDQRAGCVVQRPGFRGRPAPHRAAAPTSRRTSPSRTCTPTQLGQWRAAYSSVPSPTTSRFHCIVWSDWVSQARAELASGIRLDTNYYYYPGSWIADRPGFMNGSGMPMRFTDTDGSMIDVFQANTNMTDESGQTYPFTPNTLLDRALGSQGYYGAFTANLHTDSASTFEDTQVLASAQARGVPVIAARQLLTWTDGRNGSSFSGISWSGSTLSFTVGIGVGATGLTAMLPTTGPGGTTLSAVTRGGTAVPFTTMTVKGQQYAVFPAVGGAHQATYAAGGGGAANRVAGVAVTTSDTGDTTAAWTTEDPGTSDVLLGTTPTRLSTRVSFAGRTTDHLAELGGLRPATRYYYRVESRGPGGRPTVWPAANAAPASFMTPAVDGTAPRISRLRVLPLPDGSARVTWRTSEPATSVVDLGHVGAPLHRSGFDSSLTRSHTIVVTGLLPRKAYAVRAASRDGSGNAAAPQSRRFRTPGVGIAMMTTEDFRTGTLRGDLRVDAAGLGGLTLGVRGWGRYTSRVVDSGRKATWQRLVLDAHLPTGSEIVVRVRAGDRATPDSTWSGWKAVTRPGSRAGVAGRYVQYDVTLAAAQGGLPSVRAIGLTRTGGLSRHAEH